MNCKLVENNDPPLVSIIVPVYNGEPYIDNCLHHLLKQDYPKLEIIVVYDESTDNSLSLLTKYKNHIKLICEGKTSPAHGRNVGLRVSHGEIIGFCDIDDYFSQEKISIQTRALTDNTTIGLVYSDLTFVDFHRGISRRITCPEWNRKAWLDNGFIAFSSILVKKCVLEKLEEKDGYIFDETLPAFDDFDFLVRLSTITEFRRIPRFLTFIGEHPGRLSAKRLKMDILEARIQFKNGLYLHFLKSLFQTIPTNLPYVGKVLGRVEARAKRVAR